MANRIAAVVLAAGMSRRMGRPKALLPLGGLPMIARVVEPMLAAGSIGPIVVVTGHHADQVVGAMDGFQVEFVHNADYVDGMLSSVKIGVRAIAGRCDAFFLALGDQPLVQRLTFKLLADAMTQSPSPGNPGEGWGEGLLVGRRKTLSPALSRSTGRGGKMAQPIFHGRRGHPILLSADSIEPILALPADATLKDYTRSISTIEIPVDDPGVLADIDTPEDYHRAVANFLTDRSEQCEHLGPQKV